MSRAGLVRRGRDRGGATTRDSTRTPAAHRRTGQSGFAVHPPASGTRLAARGPRLGDDDDPSRVVGPGTLNPDTSAFYRASLGALLEAEVPFLVGGAYALACYVGVTRHTRDFDVFVRRCDQAMALEALDRWGCTTEVTFPHWLGKATRGGDLIDVIWSSGNGVAEVDDVWFQHAVAAEVFGHPVQLVPAEEMIWSKSFIMERERFDGADVAHLLRALVDRLDWRRLVDRFGGHWRVLLSHLVLLDFIYPGEEGRIPAWVMRELVARLERAYAGADMLDPRVCRGTLLSRAQYLVDVERWGYKDARLPPDGTMTNEQVRHWTAAIRRSR